MYSIIIIPIICYVSNTERYGVIGCVRGHSQEERPKACWQRLIQRTIAKPGKKGMHKGKGG